MADQAAISFRALFVGDRGDSYELLMRMLERSDIVVDDVATHGEVIASVARRAASLSPTT